jgi:hypothetical protein
MNEDQKNVLSEFDFRVLVDKSGSMGTPDAGNGRTRWQAVGESCTSFARDVNKIDTDGIDLITFGGGGVREYNGVDGEAVAAVFRDSEPRGSTPTADALALAFKTGKERGGKKQFNLVFTDGTPDDFQAVIKVLLAQANSQQTDDECTVLFVQVGNDPGAAEFLRKLDDDLVPKYGAKFDIVDTMSVADADNFSSVTDLIIKAIND